MKTLKLIPLTLICLVLANTSWSQVATTTSETSTNAILTANAKAAKEAADKKNTGPVQQIQILGSGGNVAPTNLTDQEKQLSENYIHQGKANQIIKDNCANEMSAVCNGQAGNHKFLGMDPNMVKAISSAYAMFGALAGDNLGAISKGDAALKSEAEAAGKTTDKAGKATDQTADKAKDSKDYKANDYCKYIPTMTEGVATAIQMAQSSSLNAAEVGNGDTAQKDALLKAAKSHDSRAKMAQVQAAGWFGGAACYAVNAATGQFATDKNLIIKMGAATLLGAFYQNEVSANKDYAAKTRSIANQLPGKGDCNPVTDNLCYCSQPSTENDPTYCAKGLHAKAIAANSYRVACTDNNLKIDPTCNCEKSNTCFETFLEAQGGGSLDISGIGYGSSPFSSVRSLGRGELVGGTLTNQAYDKTSAIAKRALSELISKLPPNNMNLSKDQQAVANAITSKGIPASVANLMASNPPSSGAINAAMGKFSGGTGTQYAAVSPRGSNILDFSGGSGLANKGPGKSGGDNDELLARIKIGGNGKGAINSKVLEFAQKAENQAKAAGQIRKGDDTPLFEIISMRYRTSGRRLLEVDAN
ncbi:MAG: hypothetical protein K2Q18_15790 [Bdellovibrionales bacterium]|nr:hypothetical protein [Bdellovibrionales bacterium]